MGHEQSLYLRELHFSKSYAGRRGVRSNDPFCYASIVDPSSPAGAGTSVCALDGCDVPVLQPAAGGRRRLYCSNAHRAEARRRRLVEAPDPAPGDVVGGTVVRLASVLEDLRGFEATLRAVDPGLQSLELARVRAEATAEVLAAQQASAKAAEEAARNSERLATERAGWERERTALQGEIDGLRSTATDARERAASTQEALDAAIGAHRGALDERDQLAARAAAAHEQEVARLNEQLERSATALAAAQARAEASDHRASRAEEAARDAVAHAAATEAAMSRVKVEIATAQAGMESAAERAAGAERLLEQVRAELHAERERHDVSLSQLHEQLAQLIARTPTRRPATKTAPAAKRSAAKAAAEP